MTYVCLINITISACKDNQFTCRNGLCLLPEELCNGIDECGDNSDESLADCGENEVVAK